ncbi:MAG: radical SAM protein [Blastocatellia bacterium]|nr:radical SAM protein [Blastocatellia bacterium]MCS7157703.1 radical SAM protein [Blastocatellia bacterium]MCX7751968.1 radical SAM protein [Blastocatellia bacterium]MDW8167074.1 radical SAM protein [Acidobacteriota bacterium]MDW8257178.1 radical SAM protein [Acidobacteriota bacterium]
MWVTEIFHSIQGESSYAGLPCTFVRLTGCNLRCVYCDTTYAFFGGQKMSVEEVIARVLEFWEGIEPRFPLVEITGGEPLLQKDVYPLAERLCDLGFTVLIETGGQLPIWHLDPRVVRIMDIKTPGSGHEHANLWENIEHLRPRDEVKFVLMDRRDFEWASDVIRRYDLPRRAHVLMSPVYGVLDPKALAEWVLQSRLPVRLQIQLHKVIWGPDARGV